MKLYWLLIIIIFNIITDTTTCDSNDLFSVEDVNTPQECDNIAKVGDHLLVEYSVIFQNSSVGYSVESPESLFHFILEQAGDDNIVSANIKGMCQNSTRKITFNAGTPVKLSPLLYSGYPLSLIKDESLDVVVKVVHVTDPLDYQIFSPLLEGNISAVVDLINNHHGINAKDEFGETPLIVSVRQNLLTPLAALLNTRMPKVDVNYAKSNGFTALMYSVQANQPTLLSALLRRGADPNLTVKQQGSRGNTALHFACAEEKSKHAKALLEYGASIYAKNEYGFSPLELLPRDAVRSTKLFFKKIFDEAHAKLQNKLSESSDSKEL